jgi:hypothetical protein
MSDQKLKGTLYEDRETLKRFRDFENRYYQEVTIKKLLRNVPLVTRQVKNTK